MDGGAGGSTEAPGGMDQTGVAGAAPTAVVAVRPRTVAAAEGVLAMTATPPARGGTPAGACACVAAAPWACGGAAGAQAIPFAVRTRWS